MSKQLMENVTNKQARDGAECVLSFLTLMEARKLTEAKQLLADNVAIRFPASPRMSSVEELVSWAARRYQQVSKTIVGVDAMVLNSRSVVVYCRGSLRGQWLDGKIFGGIRFVDRFELIDGLIVEQSVWNDLDSYRLADKVAIKGECDG